ncbi:cytochrome chloroplast precursor [Micractinium conductrix]|uniref:Cytochrome c-553 n=1 Tax=Micractinium conductrix TaxID=554055 RepID=A0A2P6V6G3_9CHLO|nr:cytochrome chloroplast precursor [Micractinium conductrix]|eukprot:PSC69669.1 cytochrome chloroplast precursor [Micractinium conductrix]
MASSSPQSSSTLYLHGFTSPASLPALQLHLGASPERVAPAREPIELSPPSSPKTPHGAVIPLPLPLAPVCGSTLGRRHLTPAATFGKSCTGCHAGGGNVIRRDATLQLADLQKYGMADGDGGALYDVIYSGKNSMPGFGEGCAPRGACTFGPRLADEDIRQLAEYVLAQANAGWPAAEAQ